MAVTWWKRNSWPASAAAASWQFDWLHPDVRADKLRIREPSHFRTDLKHRFPLCCCCDWEKFTCTFLVFHYFRHSQCESNWITVLHSLSHLLLTYILNCNISVKRTLIRRSSLTSAYVQCAFIYIGNEHLASMCISTCIHRTTNTSVT